MAEGFGFGFQLDKNINDLRGLLKRQKCIASEILIYFEIKHEEDSRKGGEVFTWRRQVYYCKG